MKYLIIGLALLGLGAFGVSAQENAYRLLFTGAAGDRIYVYDLASAATRELRFGRGLHQVWGVSPDSCRVLFTLSDAPDQARIYSARISDGADMQPVVRWSAPPESWSEWEPVWSPDGSRIAFTLIEAAAGYDATGGLRHRIAWVAADGGEPAFYSITGDEHTPRWSPDGAWLAYVSYEERPAGANPYATAFPDAPVTTTVREADLWVVGADGQNKTRRTDFPIGTVSQPRWSPDGFLIGFVFSPIPNQDQVWMVGSDPGALPTQLSYAEALALDLQWQQDSTAMIAAMRDFREISENRLWRIGLVGAADQTAVEIVAPQFTHLDYPRYSADGVMLAARSAYALLMMNTTNGETTLLEGDYMGNTPPVWVDGECF